MPYSSPFFPLCSLGVASLADYQNLDYVLNLRMYKQILLLFPQVILEGK